LKQSNIVVQNMNNPDTGYQGRWNSDTAKLRRATNDKCETTTYTNVMIQQLRYSMSIA